MGDQLGALHGRRVVVTRSSAQAGSLAGLLEAEGAVPVVVPLIEQVAVPEEGAALAHVIAPEWTKLGMSECRAVTISTADGQRRVWELVGADGRTVVFGSAPGRELEREPSAAAKIARLRALDGTSTEKVDLRDAPAGS